MTATKSTLFDIGADLLALNDLFEEVGGELGSPETEAAFDAWAKTLVADEGKKLDGYCGLIRTLEGEAAVAKAEAEQYAMKARTRENRVKWLKDRMKQHLELTGRTKVQTATGRTVTIQANGGKLPLLITEGTDPTKIPTEFQRVKIEIDNEKVREHLEAGGPLEFAAIGPRGSHLRIR